MITYKPGDDVGVLEDWPFDAPESDYRIVRGNPRASGRLDVGGPGQASRAGIWRCTAGVFECTEQGDELMTVLQGRCRISDLGSGERTELGPGGSLLLRDGWRVRWDVLEDVTKVFMGWKPGGY